MRRCPLWRPLVAMFAPVVGPRGFDIGALTSFALTLLQSELAPVRISAKLQTVDSSGAEIYEKAAPGIGLPRKRKTDSRATPAVE